jgi:hypothetical protein
MNVTGDHPKFIHSVRDTPLSVTNIAILAGSVRVVAIDAPRHAVQMRRRPQLFFRSDIAVARFTLNSLTHVRIVVEVDEIRNNIHPHPSDRLPPLPYLPQFNYLGTRCGHQLMAPHTGFHRRYSGDGAGSHSAVAILAINIVIGDMNLVAEVDRLTRVGRLSFTSDEYQNNGKADNKQRIEKIPIS